MDFLVDGRYAYAYTGGCPVGATRPLIVFIHGAQHDHSVWILQSRFFAHHGFSVLAVEDEHCAYNFILCNAEYEGLLVSNTREALDSVRDLIGLEGEAPTATLHNQGVSAAVLGALARKGVVAIEERRVDRVTEEAFGGTTVICTRAPGASSLTVTVSLPAHTGAICKA